jgi:hypothetical protein
VRILEASWRIGLNDVVSLEPSGAEYQVSQQATLTPRLTFRNQTGDWCRQFRLESGDDASEQIACRSEAGEWQQVARAESAPSPDPDTYQTASGGSALDPTLDRMMDGAPVDPEQERALLQQRWGGG